MPPRKPPGVRFETWIDRQIRQATERGEFRDLPGAGRPLRGLDRAYDEMWWVKDKLRREGISYLPPALALRRELHEVLEGASRARSEAELREAVEAINEKIRDALRTPQLRGPTIDVVPVNVERIVREWRARQVRRAGDED
jgi:hypothetical protein